MSYDPDDLVETDISKYEVLTPEMLEQLDDRAWWRMRARRQGDKLIASAIQSVLPWRMRFDG